MPEATRRHLYQVEFTEAINSRRGKLRRKVGVINSRLVRRDASFCENSGKNWLREESARCQALCEMSLVREREWLILLPLKSTFTCVLSYIAHFSYNLASPSAIICILLIMSYIIADTVEILACATKLRAIDVADVTFPRECHSM